MKKKYYPWILMAVSLVTAVSLTGCGKSRETGRKEAQAGQLSEENQGKEGTDILETVELTVWGAEEDEELLKQIIDGFKETYQGQADFSITDKPQGESGCKDVLIADLEAGADVFAFADDQLNTLVAAGALEPVEEGENLKTANIKEAVEAASVGGTLYAYPLTADNGYFLYYNKE